MEKDAEDFSDTFRHRLMVGICIMLALVAFGIGYRLVEYSILSKTTKQQAVVNVAVMQPQAAPQFDEIVLPGSVLAWHDATIFARTNGYLVQWIVDIGAHVKAGDLLAIIAAPEIDAELRQTEADLITAEANYNLAHTTALRWKKLLKTDSVSKQETDEKVSDENAKAAIVASTRANRDRLRDLVSFERVVAPFDGVIMSRNTDIGKLINAGSGTVPLFTIVQADRLRLYIRIPEYYSSRIVPNLTVELYFTEHPGKTYTARLLSTAKAIDTQTRTLLAEFEVDNANYELLAGSYTEVHLKIPTNVTNVHLPVNTLIFRANGMQVATVGKDNKVVLKPITIGRDYGDFVEVVAGIGPNDTVIINPGDAIFSGQKVHIVSAKDIKT